MGASIMKARDIANFTKTNWGQLASHARGLIVKFAANPAAITTIMVSPMALETANKIEPIIPGKAAGIITFLIVSDFVAPTA